MKILNWLLGKRSTNSAFSQEAHTHSMRNIEALMTGEGLQEIGILFDADKLGGFYGYHAFQLLFNSLDPLQLKECIILHGDALGMSHRIYCICVRTSNPIRLHYFSEAMRKGQSPGLLPVQSRFVTGNVADCHSLVLSGFIDCLGNFCVTANGMVRENWVDGTSWTVKECKF